MDVRTRFNVGDTVYHITQELVNSNEVCDHCGRQMPGQFGPPHAVASRVKKIYIDVDGILLSINYCLDNTNAFLLEGSLHATAEEAMAASGYGGAALS